MLIHSIEFVFTIIFEKPPRKSMVHQLPNLYHIIFTSFNDLDLLNEIFYNFFLKKYIFNQNTYFLNNSFRFFLNKFVFNF